MAAFLGKDSGLYQLRNLDFSETPTFLPLDWQHILKLSKTINPQSAHDAFALLRQQHSSKTPFLSSQDYVDLYVSGKLTPITVVERFIEQIEIDESDPKGHHPLLKYDTEELIRQAEESSVRYKTGNMLGPLDGILIAIKDEIDTLPYTTGVGTDFLDIQPSKDAVIVQRLRKAGAIIVGKTRMHEYGVLLLCVDCVLTAFSWT